VGPGQAALGRRGGFSLIEISVVLLILGMLASMTFVAMQGLLPRTELNSAIRELASTLHEARSDAIARNAEFLVEYYFEAGEGHPRGYRVVTPYRAGGVGGLAGREDERLAREWHTLPESVLFQSIVLNGETYTTGQVVVRFDALGSASDHRVHLLQQPYGHEYTIEVLALTGLIQFHEGRFEREMPEDGDFR
jgi:prepilin-type N-terminal cleavage/methylation domain-containing protein